MKKQQKQYKDFIEEDVKKPLLPDNIKLPEEFETSEEEAMFYNGIIKGVQWITDNPTAKPQFCGQTYAYGKRNEDNEAAQSLKKAIDIGNEEINQQVLHYVVWMHKNGIEKFIQQFSVV